MLVSVYFSFSKLSISSKWELFSFSNFSFNFLSCSLTSSLSVEHRSAFFLTDAVDSDWRSIFSSNSRRSSKSSSSLFRRSCFCEVFTCLLLAVTVSLYNVYRIP